MMKLRNESDDQPFVEVVVVAGGRRQVATLLGADAGLSHVDEDVLKRFKRLFVFWNKLIKRIIDFVWNTFVF